PGQCGNTAFFFKSQPDQFHFEFRGIVFPGKSFFSAHEVSTCKISGCLSYRILDSGPDGTQTTLTKEVEEAGKVFFATRKREIENYLCPDLIEEITGVAVTFTDTCDAKKIIGRAVGMKPDNVLDKFWPQMTSERIISRSTYHDGTQERSELVEILSDIVSMTR
ncbi:hypothetical protein ACTR8H_003949, partial [Escherichia coli]